jgi:hypothetical protein
MIRPTIGGISLSVVVAAQLVSSAPAEAAAHTFIVGLADDCAPPTEVLSEQLDAALCQAAASGRWPDCL